MISEEQNKPPRGGMFKGKIGGLWKPKNPHSLEYLKYLYGVLTKHAVVTEGNRTLLVEVLRAIAEILIWGDQNDGSVFDFFLEKNMLSFFLKIMKQKCGRYVCVQLLQTLNILFENLRNDTSLYYLLSNNSVNQIITHRFDFSDEEILAYYISFLKTLSLKLNHYTTIHFFFNEATNDFPLYTEAIKFFNHSESMVRIAVRTLTLNVFQVGDAAMLKFIRDRTAAPYFSNLVWFIGNRIMDLDKLMKTEYGSHTKDKMTDLIAEHLDDIHYINDILCLNIQSLNEVLTEQLIRRLFLPIYIGSLVPEIQTDGPHVSKVTALFLLSQIFIVITHKPLIEALANIIFSGDAVVFQANLSPDKTAPLSLEECLADLSSTPENTASDEIDEEVDDVIQRQEELVTNLSADDGAPLSARPIFCSLLNTLNCETTDHCAFFALSLLYAVFHNKEDTEGLDSSILSTVLNVKSMDNGLSNEFWQEIVERFLRIINLATIKDNRVRIVTLDLCCAILKEVVLNRCPTVSHRENLSVAKTLAVEQLKILFKSEELFLDIFEDEHNDMKVEKPFNIEFLASDANMLMLPQSSPLSGVPFPKRLPCGSQEHCRRAIRVYLMVRNISLLLNKEVETKLPLTNDTDVVKVDNCLNLNNSDLLSCTVMANDVKLKRFLVTDGLQMILVEPDNKKLGWGVVRYVGFLQDLEVTGDKEDSRCLHVILHSSKSRGNDKPLLLTAKFVFDDHIRCMAAKQRLTKGRQKARQYKMDLIASLLEIRAAPSPPLLSLASNRSKTDLKVPGVATVLEDDQSRGSPKDSRMSSVAASVTSYVSDVFGDTKEKSGSPPGKHSKHQTPSKTRPRVNPFSSDEGIPLEDLRLGRESKIQANSASNSSLVMSSETSVFETRQSLRLERTTGATGLLRNSFDQTASPCRSAPISPAVSRVSKRNPSETDADQSDGSIVSALLLQSHIEDVPVAVATAFDGVNEAASDPLSGRICVTPVKTPVSGAVRSGVDEVGLEVVEVELTEGVQLYDDESQLSSSIQCFAQRPKSRKAAIQEI